MLFDDLDCFVIGMIIGNDHLIPFFVIGLMSEIHEDVANIFLLIARGDDDGNPLVLCRGAASPNHHTGHEE